MSEGSFVPRSQIVNLATNYRNLVLWFGMQVLITPTLRMYQSQWPVFGLALLVTVVALTWYAFRTARALGSSNPALWGVAMLIPCINTITLLALSSKATAMCRANGIRVGFFGPRL
jgi:ABC-type uncharacterized transport system permease subunit